MSFPKILVIDDQFGRSIDDRRNLCLSFAIKDITGDDSNPEKIDNPVAESFFCSAQREENGVISNDTGIALSAVKNGWPDSDGRFWSLVLLDIRYVSGRINEKGEPQGQGGDNDFGIRILEEINRYYPDVPVVMLSSRERNDVIEECRKKGAVDFIQRIGFSSETTSPKEILKQKLAEHALLSDTRKLGDERLRITGKSLSILKALRSARRAATGKGNILILGETGTGKENCLQGISTMSLQSQRGLINSIILMVRQRPSRRMNSLAMSKVHLPGRTLTGKVFLKWRMEGRSL